MSSVSARRLWRLGLKELKETSRDRRTIVTLLMMPLLVYPLLSMALNRYLLSSDVENAAYKIGVTNQADADWIRRVLGSPDSRPPQDVLRAAGGELAEFELYDTSDTLDGKPISAPDSVLQHHVDVAIASAENPDTYRLHAFRGDVRGQNARRVLVERLKWYQMRQLERAAPQLTSPTLEIVDQGQPDNPPVLATIVPLVLVLMTITGAVYPAIDLTAGERERGTMEALMASPVPRFQVLLAKYFAVIVIAMLTAIANLIAMFVTLWLGGLLPLLTGGDAFPWLHVLQILALLILFSGFFSAVLLSLTSFARSFKEAQAYLIPVMLLSLAPGMLSLLPGIKLAGPLAIAPLINIVMLAREVLSRTANPVASAMAVISTVGYAAAALSVASHLFGSDAVTRTSNQSIASLLRRPSNWSRVPTPQIAAMVVAILVPVYFVVSNLLSGYLGQLKTSLLDDLDELPLATAAQLQSRAMVLSAVSLIMVFGLIPLAACWLGRSRLWTTYRLTRPGILAIIGAMVVGLGAWAIAHEAFVIADAVGIGGLSQQRIEETKKLLSAWQEVPLWLLLTTLALTPAVIEELCFRGFLFSSLKQVLSPARTILLTSFLFGLFHVLTGNSLLVERFVPTFLLGLVLGTIAHRSGSVVPGMVMHFFHNALLESIGHFHKQLDFLGAGFDDQTHLPATWLIVATVLTVAGMALVFRARPVKNPAIN